MNDLTEDQLTELARSSTPEQLLELLQATARIDKDAQTAAEAARRRLNLVIAVGLSRKDVNNRRMAELTGIAERALYKRPGYL